MKCFADEEWQKRKNSIKGKKEKKRCNENTENGKQIMEKFRENVEKENMKKKTKRLEIEAGDQNY